MYSRKCSINGNFSQATHNFTTFVALKKCIKAENPAASDKVISEELRYPPPPNPTRRISPFRPPPFIVTAGFDCDNYHRLVTNSYSGGTKFPLSLLHPLQLFKRPPNSIAQIIQLYLLTGWAVPYHYYCLWERAPKVKPLNVR